jgi:hypothetical protein
MALRAIWQFMDRDVTLNILYGPYTILWVTDRSINCHLARSAMDYILHSIHVNLSDDVFLLIVYLRQKTSSDKIRKKTSYWSGPVNILKYWPAGLTNTNTGRGVVLAKKQFSPTVSFSARAREFSSDFSPVIKGRRSNPSY